MKKLMLASAAIMLSGALAACSGDEEVMKDETGDQAIPVETIEAEKGDLVLDKTLYGRTEPTSTKPIMVENPGELDSLKVENGDQVDKDEEIATIKSPAGEQTIKAPQKGEVANLEAGEGDVVSDEDPLAVVADTETMKVTFTVTSDIQKLLEKDEEYQVKINDEKYDAKVTSIASMPDDSGLYPVEAEVDNEDEDILSGMVATMKVPEKRAKGAIILPTEAILEESDETFVYVIEDDEAVKTEVDVKEAQSDETAVEGEVEKGDQVVVEGQSTLADGDQVDVVKESGE